MNDRRSPQVLLVTESAEMARIWAYSLSQRMIEVSVVVWPADALSRAAEQSPDVIVLDVNVPSRFEAIDLCRRLRAETVNPILLLLPGSDETLCLKAYEAGVDECIQKPLSPLLFLAKVQSWLRRSSTVPTEALTDLQVGPLRLSLQARQLAVEGYGSVRLSNLEFRLMHALMSHRGQVLETGTLIRLVWGHGGGDAAMLKNVVYRLRTKIEPENADRDWIQTVPGQGYRFQPR
jgi:DNA-binding response OmpR family regulator